MMVCFQYLIGFDGGGWDGQLAPPYPAPSKPYQNHSTPIETITTPINTTSKPHQNHPKPFKTTSKSFKTASKSPKPAQSHIKKTITITFKSALKIIKQKYNMLHYIFQTYNMLPSSLGVML